MVGLHEIAGSRPFWMNVCSRAENCQAHDIQVRFRAEASTALLKAVPEPEQQAAGGLDLLLRQSLLKDWSNKRNMGTEDSLEQGVAFLRQPDFRASFVAGDRFPSDQPLLRQPVEYAG